MFLIKLHAIELQGTQLPHPLHVRIYFVFILHKILHCKPLCHNVTMTLWHNGFRLILFLDKRHEGIDAQHHAKIKYSHEYNRLRRRPSLFEPSSEQVAEKEKPQ